MRPLRAYLWIVYDEDDVSVTTHRDLESLVSAWQTRNIAANPTGIIHIGFDRSDTSSFLPMAHRFQGRVLLTASARFALTHSTTVAPLEAGVVEEIPIFVATSGWGYSCTPEELGLSEHDLAGALHDNATPTPFSGWLVPLADTEPTLAHAASLAGIHDEKSYQANEYRLTSADRRALGLFRLKALGYDGDIEDPCQLVRLAPPWLLNRPVTSLPLSVRIRNAFATNNIATSADLQRFSKSDLLGLRNFGRTSLAVLTKVLLSALDEGPLDDQILLNTDHETFLSLLRASIAALPERPSYILRRRMGLDLPRATLQEIGDELNLTRERVRQIEAKYLDVREPAFAWIRHFVQRVTSMLESRKEPIPIQGLDLIDPWFAQASAFPNVLRYLSETFGDRRFFILDIRSQTFVTALSPEQWSTAVSNGQRILETAREQRWTEPQARQAVEALLTGPGEELRQELWKNVSRNAHFASIADNEPVLVGFGRGMENSVEAILAESPHPLHYSEIAERAALRLARPVDIRRIHNAAAEVGHLFGRGIYALPQHFPLTQEEAETIAVEVETIISAGPPDRQWHCAELLDALVNYGLDPDQRLTPYIINFALHQNANSLANLGRLVWTLGNGRVLGTAHRIDVHQAVVAILREAGTPLTTSQLRERLIESRGIGTHFQIQVQPPLCRLGKGLWGLLDRDAAMIASQADAPVCETTQDSLAVCSQSSSLQQAAHTSATSHHLPPPTHALASPQNDIPASQNGGHLDGRPLLRLMRRFFKTDRLRA